MTAVQDYKEITKQSYDEHAEEFASFAAAFRGKLKQWIASFADQLKANDQVLDVGCGAGRDAHYFIEHGLHVTGIDNSEKLIDLAKIKVPDGAFFVMDFEELPLPKESFEGVWASASLVHVPRENLLPILKRIHALLKPGGVFFSSWRVGKGEKFTVEKRGNAELKRYYTYYDPEELIDLMKKADFIEVTHELDEIETGMWVGVFAHK
ncbi:MAG: class I SAM-dependent methyltransferase [Candidatus Levybacteria bacterium]|nr:class I SAM-dependent methyltransferase [Candidatus Levybacteria bacterium]